SALGCARDNASCHSPGQDADGRRTETPARSGGWGLIVAFRIRLSIHDLYHQPFPDPGPPGRGREQARPHAARATHARRHRLFGAPGRSSKEGLNALLNLPRPSMAGAFSVQGKSVSLTFAYGVMYVLSFATIITVFATAIALAALIVMIAWRSMWRLLRRRSIPLKHSSIGPPI